MPKNPSLIPQKTNAGWLLNVPASISETGKRKRLRFETRKQAELEAARISAQANLWGQNATKISASLSDQAARAEAILEPYGANLVEAAKFYAQHIENQRRSVTFEELWKQFEISRSAKAEAHQVKIRWMGSKLIPRLGKKLVATIDHILMRSTMQELFPGPGSFNAAHRTVSPAFNLAVKEGWASENPFRRIDKIDTGRKTIEVLNFEQARAWMQSTIDYRQNETMPDYLRKDGRGATAAAAIMLFAGVRPAEMARLEWGDVDLEAGTIFISNAKAKTDRSRFFTMPDTLREWLLTVPTSERWGSVCPPNWRKVYQAMRRHSGISNLCNDVLRKTFATAHLAHFGDVKLTREIMGHETGDVLFRHYRGLMKPKEAARIFSILPGKGDIKEAAQ